jgi:lysophospholipase L1-like esterase
MSALAMLALLLALYVTPPQVVTAFGQTLELGSVEPSSALGLSGPGEADLFGEGPVRTSLTFPGPLRPRLVWQRFNRDDAAGQFIQTTSVDGRRSLQTEELGADLADGWLGYFARLVLVAGALGAALYLIAVGVLALVRRAPAPLSRRRLATLLGVSVALPCVLALAAGGVTAGAARQQLSGVSTLSDLIGTSRLTVPPAATGQQRTDVDVVVIGDSTAAGVGNTPLARPTRLDTICGRSADAYASVLQSATGLRVLNLACSSATLPYGVLGRQTEADGTVPPQIGVLKSIVGLRAVVLSVGANDVGWSDFLQYCYAFARCDDQASEQLFLTRLDTFRLQYAQLLQQLSALPTRPAVVVTGYYDPFGSRFDCPELTAPSSTPSTPGDGFAASPGRDDQAERISLKIDPLRVHAAALNDVLAQGAHAFEFAFVQPSFAGHALCDPQSWVQGLSDRYPFHPDAAGELAIAAAQLPQLAPLIRR